MKLEKMKAPVAGHYLPIKHASKVIRDIVDSGMPEEFVDGVLFATSFFTCPTEKDMHGMTPNEFLYNFLKTKTHASEPPAEVVRKARNIIKLLEGMGVNVESACIVKGGN